MERTSERDVRVVLCHPDKIRLALFDRALRRAGGFDLLSSTSDQFQAVDEALDWLPDVLAITAEGQRLPLLVRRVRDAAPGVAVLILEPTEADFTAIGEGAIGALPAGGSELAQAVRSAASHESIISAELAQALLDAPQNLPEHVRRAAAYTQTELEVLHRLASGESARDIAWSHEVTERLVRLHTGYAVVKYQRAAEALRVLLEDDEARSMA